MTAISLAELNQLGEAETIDLLNPCCRWTEWPALMAGTRPFRSLAEAVDVSARLIDGLTADGLTEVLNRYDPIGAPAAGASVSAAFSAQEESGIDDRQRLALVELAHRYAEKFGFTFLIAAAGLSGDAIAQQLRERLPNTGAIELELAREQLKLKVGLRLRQLVTDEGMA